jgi:hypothetical protein
MDPDRVERVSFLLSIDSRAASTAAVNQVTVLRPAERWNEAVRRRFAISTRPLQTMPAAVRLHRHHRQWTFRLLKVELTHVLIFLRLSTSLSATMSSVARLCWTLSTNLRICKENGRAVTVAKMARKLDQVVDALNEPS